jgi:hypothetical protein
MKKAKIRKLTEEAIASLSCSNVYMVYADYSYNLVPLKASERLFLAIDEDDFIFDGYRISRFKDVRKMRIKTGKCDEILRSEGLFNNIGIPEIDLENWQTVFEGLKAMGKNIIVQYETESGNNNGFWIGKIDRVCKNCLYMYHFDADGIWETEPCRIPYNEVTSVTFDSRYVNVFSKYLPEAPCGAAEAHNQAASVVTDA